MGKLRCTLRHYPIAAGWATAWAAVITGLCVFNFGRGWGWW